MCSSTSQSQGTEGTRAGCHMLDAGSVVKPCRSQPQSSATCRVSRAVRRRAAASAVAQRAVLRPTEPYIGRRGCPDSVVEKRSQAAKETLRAALVCVCVCVCVCFVEAKSGFGPPRSPATPTLRRLACAMPWQRCSQPLSRGASGAFCGGGSLGVIPGGTFRIMSHHASGLSAFVFRAALALSY